MSINPIARELNTIINAGNPHLLEMFSKVGRRLYFPKGILKQSGEARQQADPRFNATIGIATENQGTMHLPAIMQYLNHLSPSEALTYAPSYGIPDLRKLWKQKIYQKNPSLQGKTCSLPVLTNGITHGISIFADMFNSPDDVLLFPDKMWGNNALIMTVRGDARISTYPMFSEEHGFNLKDFEECVIREAACHHKITVILNFPNNPTGYTLTEKEGQTVAVILEKIAQQGTNVIAVLDDAYFGLRYEDNPMKESLFARLCNSHPRLLAVKLDGATKEMFVWGLRVGFITYGTQIKGDPSKVYDALERKTAGNIRGSMSNTSHAGQSIVLKALQAEGFEAQHAQKVKLLQARARRIKEVLTNPAYNDAWEMYPFNSGYFMCLKLKSTDAETLRLHLLEKYKVGLIAINKTDLRIAFSSVDEENIKTLFDYIYAGVQDLKN